MKNTCRKEIAAVSNEIIYTDSMFGEPKSYCSEESIAPQRIFRVNGLVAWK